jgi:predicted phosphodiesterase
MRTRTDIAAPIVVAVPLALVSDIHGSDDALATVVGALEQLDIDRVICLGDAVQGGDQPREVLDRLAQLGWPVVLGNADAFLLEVPSESPEPLTQEQLDKREWTLAQLEPSHLAQIRSFVPTLDVELDDGMTLRAFHGSPDSYDDVLLPDTPDAQVERLLGGSGVDLLAGGHTHMQWTRYVDGALYVNPGSIRDDGAYAIVTGGSVEFRKAPWQNVS